jgi:hypothetical protein
MMSIWWIRHRTGRELMKRKSAPAVINYIAVLSMDECGSKIVQSGGKVAVAKRKSRLRGLMQCSQDGGNNQFGLYNGQRDNPNALFSCILRKLLFSVSQYRPYGTMVVCIWFSTETGFPAFLFAGLLFK